MKLRPIEMLLGEQVGVIEVVPFRNVRRAEVKCYNGYAKMETSFITTLEKGEAIDAWLKAGRPGLIQEALPTLTVEEREQCLSGMTPEQWNEMLNQE